MASTVVTMNGKTAATVNGASVSVSINDGIVKVDNAKVRKYLYQLIKNYLSTQVIVVHTRSSPLISIATTGLFTLLTLS